jgi:hypothetical protein
MFYLIIEDSGTRTGSPSQEPPEFAAMFPTEAKKSLLVDLLGVQTPVGFDAPLQIRTFPRLKAISASGFPQEGEHYFCDTLLVVLGSGDA